MMYTILAVVIHSSDNTTAGLVNQKKTTADYRSVVTTFTKLFCGVFSVANEHYSRSAPSSFVRLKTPLKRTGRSRNQLKQVVIQVRLVD